MVTQFLPVKHVGGTEYATAEPTGVSPSVPVGFRGGFGGPKTKTPRRGGVLGQRYREPRSRNGAIHQTLGRLARRRPQ